MECFAKIVNGFKPLNFSHRASSKIFEKVLNTPLLACTFGIVGKHIHSKFALCLLKLYDESFIMMNYCDIDVKVL